MFDTDLGADLLAASTSTTRKVTPEMKNRAINVVLQNAIDHEDAHDIFMLLGISKKDIANFAKGIR